MHLQLLCTLSTRTISSSSVLCSAVNICGGISRGLSLRCRRQMADGKASMLRTGQWERPGDLIPPSVWTQQPISQGLSASLNPLPAPPKSNPILLKLNVELSNPVRGTSNNLFSKQGAQNSTFKGWLTFYDRKHTSKLKALGWNNESLALIRQHLKRTE